MDEIPLLDGNGLAVGGEFETGPFQAEKVLLQILMGVLADEVGADTEPIHERASLVGSRIERLITSGPLTFLRSARIGNAA